MLGSAWALWAPISTTRGADCGQHAKIANQIIIAGTLSGTCEALTYAKAKGLDLHVLISSLTAGVAGSKQLDAFGEKIVAGEYALFLSAMIPS